MSRFLFVGAVLASTLLAGCNSSAAEESSAATQLAPKPLSQEQKSQIAKITGGTPPPQSAHAGG